MKTTPLLSSLLLGAMLSPLAQPVVAGAVELQILPFSRGLDASDASSSDPAQDNLYSDGTRAINDGRWADAEAVFTRIAKQHGDRAEAAMYWKAYAENRAGKPARALESCSELRHAYPHGKWREECGALEIEVRSKTGSPMQPQSEQNDELKLLALNSLMQQDEARALPMLQQILTSDKSEAFKDRALFVLAQNQSKQAQDTLDQIARGRQSPDLQSRAIQMIAITRARQSAAILSDIYRQSSDDRVKRAVLQSYLVSANADQLVDRAVHETDPELRHFAIQSLGALGAASQLLDLYRKSSSDETKAAVINGLIAAGTNGADALGTIATSERNPDLRRRAIRNLGIAGGMGSAPALMTTYRNNSDPETRKAALEALFLAGDSHDLVELARAEKDPAMKEAIVQRLSVMQSKEATDYMFEILK